MGSTMMEIKDDLLFGEDNSFLELAISAELENEEQYQGIIGKTMHLVNQMHSEERKDTDFGEFIIHHKNLSHIASDSSVTLELHIGDVNENMQLKTLTLEEYVKQVHFRILDESEGYTYHESYDFTARGLLEALMEFNRLAN